MKATRYLSVVGAALVIAMTFTACGGNKSSQGANSSNANGQAVMSAALHDGTYLATYAYTDGHGWQEFLQMTVSGGKITAATFDAINAGGQLKTANEQYNSQMKAVAGTNPLEYTKALASAFLAKQTTPVDVVTGATESSHDFNQLADQLLAQAKAGNSTPVVLPQNATYTAELKADDHGWTPHLEVTFDNGQISKVYFDGVQKNDKGQITARKTTDQSFQTSYTNATKNNVNDVFAKLETELQQSGDPSKVDAVSGATTFSNDFKTLAQQILQSQRVSVSPDKITAAIK